MFISNFNGILNTSSYQGFALNFSYQGFALKLSKIEVCDQIDSVGLRFPSITHLKISYR